MLTVQQLYKAYIWLAETPICWIVEFQMDSIFSYLYNFGHIKKLSANKRPKLSENVEFSWNFCLRHSGVSASLGYTGLYLELVEESECLQAGGAGELLVRIRGRRGRRTLQWRSALRGRRTLQWRSSSRGRRTRHRSAVPTP